jgi:predicted Rossmann fold flavoprotein
MKPLKTHVYIGGGAAGYFGAINSAEKNPEVKHILLEATHRPMTKIKVSGGGRCNVTHHCFEPSLLVKNYPRGSKELLGAFSRFQPKDTIAWFAKRGVELKVEDDGRMFPLSNSSDTIIACFNKEVERLNVEVRKGAKVSSIRKEDGLFLIEMHNKEVIQADRVLMATGSVPAGYELAASLGHHMIEPCPSLFTFNCSHALLKEMMGTSFKKVSLTLETGEPAKSKWQQQGPLLITHWGLSGPAVLKLSAFAARELWKTDYQAKLRVNWLGDAKQDEIFALLTQHKNDFAKKSVLSSTLFDFSKRFWQQILNFSLPENKIGPWADLNKQDLKNLAKTLTDSELLVEGKGVFKEEFVSCGGVDLKELDFKTLESKICPGLYFAGEILNIDGITGGFNFQNAWTTSWLAAQHM